MGTLRKKNTISGEAFVIAVFFLITTVAAFLGLNATYYEVFIVSGCISILVITGLSRLSKNRTNNYIFGPQSSTNLKARGGTEKIVSLLCKQRGFKLVIEREDLKNINDSHVLLTGVNLISKFF